MDLLHDETLRLILERIGSQVPVTSAAATCKHWRSVIVDAAFLRRFRSLNPATIAGNYHNYSPTRLT